MTVPAEEAPANYVPAAAVRRGVQALSGITGRKEFCRRLVKFLFKSPGSTWISVGKLIRLRKVGTWGTNGGAVKCVDIIWNTKGEGTMLGFF